LRGASHVAIGGQPALLLTGLRSAGEGEPGAGSGARRKLRCCHWAVPIYNQRPFWVHHSADCELCASVRRDLRWSSCALFSGRPRSGGMIERELSGQSEARQLVLLKFVRQYEVHLRCAPPRLGCEKCLLVAMAAQDRAAEIQRKILNCQVNYRPWQSGRRPAARALPCHCPSLEDSTRRDAHKPVRSTGKPGKYNGRCSILRDRRWT